MCYFFGVNAILIERDSDTCKMLESKIEMNCGRIKIDLISSTSQPLAICKTRLEYVVYLENHFLNQHRNKRKSKLFMCIFPSEVWSETKTIRKNAIHICILLLVCYDFMIFNLWLETTTTAKMHLKLNCAQCTRRALNMKTVTIRQWWCIRSDGSSCL